MNVGDEIAAAFAEIGNSYEEEQQRLKYQAAMKILRSIPNGTRDEDLTPEQRQAWKDHDDAIATVRH